MKHFTLGKGNTYTEVLTQTKVLAALSRWVKCKTEA